MKVGHAVSNTKKSVNGVPPCSHRGNTQKFMHAKDATVEANKSFIMKANGTNVVVIAESALPLLNKLGLQR